MAAACADERLVPAGARDAAVSAGAGFDASFDAADAGAETPLDAAERDAGAPDVSIALDAAAFPDARPQTCGSLPMPVDGEELLVGSSVAYIARVVWAGDRMSTIWVQHEITVGDLRFDYFVPGQGLTNYPGRLITPEMPAEARYENFRYVWNGSEFGLVYVDTIPQVNRPWFVRLDGNGAPIGRAIPLTEQLQDQLVTAAIAWNHLDREWGIVWQSITDVHFERRDTAGNLIGTPLIFEGVMWDVGQTMLFDGERYAVVTGWDDVLKITEISRQGTILNTAELIQPVTQQPIRAVLAQTADQWAVLWRDYPDIVGGAARFARMNKGGEFIAGSQVTLTPAGILADFPAMASDGSSFVAIWTSQDRDIWRARVGLQSEILEPAAPAVTQNGYTSDLMWNGCWFSMVYARDSLRGFYIRYFR